MRLFCAAFGALLLAACDGSGGDNTVPIDPPSTGDFTVSAANAELNLLEGDSAGLNVPLTLTRSNGHTAPIELSLVGSSDADAAFVSATFSQNNLTTQISSSTLNIQLAIGDIPLLAHQRHFTVRASDGSGVDQFTLSIDIEPVDAPDIYLLVGQSNMVGFSGEGTRQALPGEPDESSARIFQLNVSKNDQFDVFTSVEDFTSAPVNVVAPLIITAEDPLHIPLDPNNTTKDLDYIGLGLSFAKAALQDTTRNIILVPAAWSGSAFCDNEGGPNGQWNAQPIADPDLGNTWLFDRAVTRADIAIAETGGILRGILWHQGESDANERCAVSYAANIERLAFQLRLQITADARGGDLRRSDANIPFVVGTMSRGIDERGDLSDFSESKQTIDLAHRNIPSQVNHAAVSNHDDLTPANGFGCGNTTCVHFGAEALREMGQRYYQALRLAVGQTQ